MFTGIIEACVPVRSVRPQGSGLRILLPAPGPDWVVEVGESIATCGCCLTVVHLQDPATGARVPSRTPGADMLFELSKETLDRTWFGRLAEGTPVNLERSMRLGDRLSGHIVSGHVDGGGELVAIEDPGDGGMLYHFQVDPGLERYLIEKGSVGIDGISLTVCEPKAGRFFVALIPVTLAATNLGSAKVGQRFNIEADQVGKWIERLLP
ncbi:MAG: riboflavin synthase [Planctomycetes bacterium]|nr:riboflavin synthase [Planctomycetota bacterium]